MTMSAPLKIAVAMSGGVDSSVAACLLKKDGHDVVGVTMCLGVAPAPGGKVKCCGAEEIEDARRVCLALGIRHYVLDFGSALEQFVIRPFVEEYRNGRTPNPCVACNRAIKFGALLDKVVAMGFDRLATGHYAGIAMQEGGYRLCRAKDTRKDQTYFLWGMPRAALARVVFPLADLAKAEVRALAARERLPIQDKPESQDICFMSAGGIGEFLADRGVELAPGDIVNPSGAVIGRHHGFAAYTIGQRSGLGIAAPTPRYVLALDAARNRIVAGERNLLLSGGLFAEEVNLLTDELPQRVLVKIRHAHTPAPATVALADGRLNVRFDKPQEAVTPGQSVVLYDQSTVLAGGVIREALKPDGAHSI